jgi:hypothetical protein
MQFRQRCLGPLVLWNELTLIGIAHLMLGWRALMKSVSTKSHNHTIHVLWWSWHRWLPMHMLCKCKTLRTLPSRRGVKLVFFIAAQPQASPYGTWIGKSGSLKTFLKITYHRQQNSVCFRWNHAIPSKMSMFTRVMKRVGCDRNGTSHDTVESLDEFKINYVTNHAVKVQWWSWHQKLLIQLSWQI